MGPPYTEAEEQDLYRRIDGGPWTGFARLRPREAPILKLPPPISEPTSEAYAMKLTKQLALEVANRSTSASSTRSRISTGTTCANSPMSLYEGQFDIFQFGMLADWASRSPTRA